MIKPTDENYQKLVSLFQEESTLFELINPQARKWQGASEDLYRDGESDLIVINNKTYRFDWESVEEYGIEE